MIFLFPGRGDTYKCKVIASYLKMFDDIQRIVELEGDVRFSRVAECSQFDGRRQSLQSSTACVRDGLRQSSVTLCEVCDYSGARELAM